MMQIRRLFKALCHDPEAYQKGFKTGYELAKTENAANACIEASIDQYSTIFNRGHSQGVAIGKAEGYAQGRNDGYQLGFEQAFSKSTSFDEGYKAGVAETQQQILRVIEPQDIEATKQALKVSIEIMQRELTFLEGAQNDTTQ